MMWECGPLIGWRIITIYVFKRKEKQPAGNFISCLKDLAFDSNGNSQIPTVVGPGGTVLLVWLQGKALTVRKNIPSASKSSYLLWKMKCLLLILNHKMS